MKTLLLAMMMSIGITCVAGENCPALEPEFTIQIPEHVERTFDMKHHQSGLEFTLYLSEEAEDGQYIAAIMQVPMSEISDECDKDCSPMLASMLQGCGMLETLDLKEFGISMDMQEAPSLLTGIESYRLRGVFQDEDEDGESPLNIDIHAFYLNDSLVAIMTGFIAEEMENQLDDFTNEVIQTVCFAECHEEHEECELSLEQEAPCEVVSDCDCTEEA